MTANKDYEKTLRWISNSIKKYDQESINLPKTELEIRNLELLNTIKLCCDIDTGELDQNTETIQ
jgi:hypothetical protein|tara:strand:+ start:409 stop:600 length:192 start_codon:yes stop_codon:yes gene_type:complete